MKERRVLRKLREYWNEAQEIEEDFRDDPYNIILKENALIQLDEKYAKLIMEIFDMSSNS